jgi:hypothetical protein
MVAGKGTNGLTARGRAMRRVLTRWERSGLTLAEFARRAGMRPGTLGWWRHALRAGERTPGRGRFVEVPVPSVLAAVPVAPPPFEVVFGDGTVVRVPAVFDAVAFERLLALVVDRRGC